MFSTFVARTQIEPYVIDILPVGTFSLMSLAATLEPLRAANRVSGQILYRWHVISMNGEPVPTSSGIPLPVVKKFESTCERDTLIVLASFEVPKRDRQFLSTLRRLSRSSIPIGGIEAGSWVLAHAGLLDRRRATTHWEDLELFADAFPGTEVVPDRYVIDRGVYTAGGAMAALDMMLELIRSQHGLNLAMDVASVFIYDPHQPATDPQRTVSVGRLAHHHPQLAAAIRLMEQRLADPLPIAQIAGGIGLSARSLENRFQEHLRTSPHNYYLGLRLSAARRMLQQSALTITEIADAAGFGSASAFARAFRNRFGGSPGAARSAFRQPG